MTTQGSTEGLSVSDHINIKVKERIEELMENKMDDLIKKMRIKVQKLSGSLDYLFDQASNAIRHKIAKRKKDLKSLKQDMEKKIETIGMIIGDATEHSKGISDMKDETRRQLEDKFKHIKDDVQNETVLAWTYTKKQTSDFFQSISYQPPEAIYFSAILSQNVGPTEGYVTFDSVLTNKGTGYDSQTGIFTAPRVGCYVFTCTFLAGNGYVNVQMMKNGNETANAYAAGQYEENTGVLSENMELIMGDQIGIRLIPGWNTGVIRGDFYSTFSGFMTHQK